MRPAHTRSIAIVLVVSLVVGAGVVSPAFVFGEEPATSSTPAPSAPPPTAPPTMPPGQSAAPTPSISPQPTGEPTASPDASPKPESTDDVPPGVERVDLRTADSRTYEQTDGTFVTEAFAGPIFYRPEGGTTWEPIDARFSLSNDAGLVAEVES